MTNPESKHPVTVEDLLRIKRAERPPPEFWNQFDEELRAKQLAALVEKRPWWRRLPPVLSGMARYHLPLGATAVLAITLLSIRDYHPIVPSSDAEISPSGNVAEASASATSSSSVIADETETVRSEHSEAMTLSDTPAAAPLRSEATAPGQLVRMVPLLPADGPMADHPEVSPSARSMAENLAVAEAILGTPSGASTSSFETRAIPSRPAPREPLAQMPTPSESRRSRFAAAFASMATETSIAPSARVARRLSDEQLYDSIHRFGASGNSVSFRF